MSKMDWIVVRKFRDQPIGAVGFVGSRAAVIAAFYDDADGDDDGSVSLVERAVYTISPVNLRGRQVVAVAMAARLDTEILSRDAGFGAEAMQLYLNFARGLISDGLYAVYFARGIKGVSGQLAERVSSDLIKQFVIRKGMEKAVKAAYDGTVR